MAVLALSFGVGLPLQLWGVTVGPLPLMNYGPGTANTVVYALLGPFVGYLLLRRASRARTSAYMFCTFDVLRSLRLSHWLPAVLDLFIVVYLQTPAMRRVYPSVWSRMGGVKTFRIGSRT